MMRFFASCFLSISQQNEQVISFGNLHTLSERQFRLLTGQLGSKQTELLDDKSFCGEALAEADTSSLS